MFDWDDIRVFLAVVRNGTVRGAARHLGITHATVSRRLRGLEEILGARLFERTSGGQTLSAIGESILGTAEQIEAKMAEIDRRAFAMDTRLAGAVRLSVSDSLLHALLHPILQDFHAHYPMIEIELTSSDRFSDLALREADIVIRITRAPQESAYGRKIADSPWGFFASRDYLRRRPAQDRWVGLTHKPALDPQLPAKRVITVNNGIAATQLIKSGFGIGLLACFLGDSDPALQRVPGTKLIHDLSVWALVHADIRTMPRVRALMDHLYGSLEISRDLIEGRRPNT